MPIQHAVDCGDSVRASGAGVLDATDPVAVAKALVPYRRASNRRGVLEVLITGLPLTAIWVAACVAIHVKLWWGLALVLPAAAFLVRLFMIQHDCGHGSFFVSKRSNDWLGRVLGVLTLTPYDYWRHSHAVHHATCGNLDRRSLGAVETLTVTEFAALGWWGRLGYRLYRHPLVMFGLGPAYMFVLQQRLPIGLMRGGWRPWLSTMGTNLALLAFAGVTVWLLGWQAVLFVSLPTAVLAATAGVWLFFVQHQFEETHWTRNAAWDLRGAALKGSSHYDLPPIARWFTANIGLHHVHHLSSRIPSYRLGEVLKDLPQLGAPGRITVPQSFRCIGLALWDEASQRLVSFAEYRQLYGPAGAALG